MSTGPSSISKALGADTLCFFEVERDTIFMEPVDVATAVPCHLPDPDDKDDCAANATERT